MSNSSNETVGFIMPVYNEEEILRDKMEQLVHFLYSLDINFEILVIENGSTDQTPQILNQLQDEFPEITTKQLEQANIGRSKKHGIKITPHSKNFIVHIDHWDTNFIEKGLEFLNEVPVVQGTKCQPDSKDNRPFLRRVLTWGYNWCLRILVNFDGTDTRGLKGFQKEEILPIVQKCKTEREMFETELIVRCQRMGIEVREIPVKLRMERPQRNWMFHKIWQNIVDLVKLTWVIRFQK